MHTPVHVYINVTDMGENLVGTLGLQTVPQHVLVSPSGQLISTLARKKLPDRRSVEALMESVAGGDGGNATER